MADHGHSEGERKRIKKKLKRNKLMRMKSKHNTGHNGDSNTGHNRFSSNLKMMM